MRDEYIAFQVDGARGYCLSPIEPHLPFFLRELEGWLAGQDQRSYSERPKHVVGFRLPPVISDALAAPEFRVVLKRFVTGSLVHRLFGSWVDPRALRSFRTAVRLRRAGVRTPQPVIAWESRVSGQGSIGHFITREIADAVLYRTYFEAPGSGEGEGIFEERLAQLARLVRGIHDAGVLHRDLTLGNFLIGADSDDKGIFVIDLSRGLSWKRLPLVLRLMDLARVSLHEHWPAFFQTYTESHPRWRQYEFLRNGFAWMRQRRRAVRQRLKRRG